MIRRYCDRDGKETKSLLAPDAPMGWDVTVSKQAVAAIGSAATTETAHLCSDCKRMFDAVVGAALAPMDKAAADCDCRSVEFGYREHAKGCASRGAK